MPATGMTTNCIAGRSHDLTWRLGGPLYSARGDFLLVANYTNSANATVTSPPDTATSVYAPPTVTVGAAPGGINIQFQ